MSLECYEKSVASWQDGYLKGYQKMREEHDKELAHLSKYHWHLIGDWPDKYDCDDELCLVAYGEEGAVWYETVLCSEVSRIFFDTDAVGWKFIEPFFE